MRQLFVLSIISLIAGCYSPGEVVKYTPMDVEGLKKVMAKNVASQPAQPEAKKPVKVKIRKNAYAVIIGNKLYQDQGKGAPDVAFAINDARAMKTFAKNQLGIDVGNMIYFENASQADFVGTFGNEKSHKAKLFNLLRDKNSEVFIFYSGHGAPSLNDGKGYLLPVDADPTTVEFNGYPLETFYNNIAKLPAKNVTVVIDACFSGSSSNGSIVQNTSSISLKRVDVSRAAKNITLLTAAGVSEVASWDTEARKGLFTNYFIKGVSGDADAEGFGNQDGKITLGELKKYLKSEVSYMARREYNRQQHPEIVGDVNQIITSLQ